MLLGSDMLRMFTPSTSPKAKNRQGMQNKTNHALLQRHPYVRAISGNPIILEEEEDYKKKKRKRKKEMKRKSNNQPPVNATKQ